MRIEILSLLPPERNSGRLASSNKVVPLSRMTILDDSDSVYKESPYLYENRDQGFGLSKGSSSHFAKNHTLPNNSEVEQLPPFSFFEHRTSPRTLRTTVMKRDHTINRLDFWSVNPITLQSLRILRTNDLFAESPL